MVRETKLYDVLGVSPSASEQEIRRAYKLKAVQMHPDKGGDEEAFKEICHAHSILSDSEKRRRYDIGGAEAVSSDAGGDGGMSAGDLFGAMFGGGGRSRAEPKPRDIVHTIEVPLEQFYRGKTVKLAITRNRNCETCKGSGSNKPGISVTCGSCNGRGQRTVVQQVGPGMMAQTTIPCSACRGRGTTIDEKDKCGDCKGRQVVEKRDVFSVTIEKGSRTGDTQRFPGQGDNVPGVRAAGDVVIAFKEKPHKVFTRYGKHLLVEQTITLADALCGFEFIIPHLDGRHLIVKSSPGQVIKPGVMYSIHHEGMPVKGSGGFDKGDLLVKTNIIFPPVVPPATQAVLREVLGPMKKAPLPSSSADFYETHMRETTISLADLGGKAEESSDDEGHGAPRAQCTQA